jgi:hypothetical protein
MLTRGMKADDVFHEMVRRRGNEAAKRKMMCDV